MSLEDLVDAHLAGERPDVPADLRGEFDRAVAGHAALLAALAEPAATGPFPAIADRPPPELPADYEIVRELGRGGMGVVYLVQQKSLGRPVAVKVLRPGEATFGRVVQRFLEEARHLARLRHANIVAIHEIGRAGDEPYFTMDYVEGEALSALLARERPSPSRALALVKQVAEGIAYAHGQGIVHRDLKPGNVLIDRHGRAYVTDFGLSRDLTRDSALTHPGEVMGTPAYMSPEQANGQTELIGEATDIHALGAILYEMLTGRLPYGNDAPIDVLIRVVTAEPAAPRRLDRRIPRDLETICLKCLAKAPERRYATVRALLEDVRRFEAGEPILARRPGLLARGVRTLSRHWRLATAVVLTAVITGILASSARGLRPSELMAAGDERHEAGKHAEAVQFYRRALPWAGDPLRREILERLVRCCRAAGDDDGAVAAAVQMLDYDPDAWFGLYDYAVAQAVRAGKRRVKANSFFSINRDIPPDELALKRLQIFLNGPYGTDAERGRTEQAAAELRLTLGTVPAGFTGATIPPLTFPTGVPADLLRKAVDARAGRLERTAAAVGAGMALEKAGDAPAALAAYHTAYDLLRPRFPAYAGVTRGLEMSHPRSWRLEWPECSALRHIAHALRRLDPALKDPLRGGLRFRIVGLDLPPDTAVLLAVSLWDPAADDPDRRSLIVNGETVAAPVGEVAVQLDQTAWVGVADGRYRLVVQTDSAPGGSTFSDNYGARAKMVSERLILDCSGIPKEVEVRGATVDLPPIRAHLRE
jgi:tetratricopeptide (TPR) repeat protein/predicted Ser/Thr protein kinase